MVLLRAFQLPGCRFWFYTGDHEPPHFHARAGDEWEIRVFFLQEPPEYEVKFAVRHVSSRMVKQIRELATKHRVKLLKEWERSQADE